MKTFNKKYTWIVHCVALCCMLFMIFSFAACSEKMNLPTTNERLDSTEKQLTYQTNSMDMCPLEKAYEKGWLTQTDLAYAMYYATGKVYICTESEWEKYKGEVKKELDFTPEEECPAIDSQVERDIKRLEYEGYPNKDNLTFEEFEQNLSFRFVGSYNGTFVITDVKTKYWAYPTDVPPPIRIADFVWYGSYEMALFAVRYE